MPVPEFAGSDILLRAMSSRKTIARGVAGAFGLLAVLLLALGALMPRWINEEAVKAEGDLDDPTVSILPPSEVVKGLLGVAERVLKLPVRIFEGGIP